MMLTQMTQVQYRRRTAVDDGSFVRSALSGDLGFPAQDAAEQVLDQPNIRTDRDQAAFIVASVTHEDEQQVGGSPR